jgi:hypothetical protein
MKAIYYLVCYIMIHIVCSTTLDIPVHGSLSIRDDNATYTCAANYKIQGVAVRQCSNGEWLGNTPKCILECSRLENPVNGNVTVSGNTAHYKCNADYYIEGSVLRTCKDQKWTGSAPLCTKQCTPLSPPNHGFVSFVGQQATFHCNDHFKLIGNKGASCIDGRWSSSIPLCVFGMIT